MRWYQRNLAERRALEEPLAPGSRVVRRVEIIVERETCSVETHRVGTFQRDGHCPTCGQSLTGPPALHNRAEQPTDLPAGNTLPVNLEDQE